MAWETSLAVLDASLMLSNLGLTPSHLLFHIHTPAIWFPQERKAQAPRTKSQEQHYLSFRNTWPLYLDWILLSEE